MIIDGPMVKSGGVEFLGVFVLHPLFSFLMFGPCPYVLPLSSFHSLLPFCSLPFLLIFLRGWYVCAPRAMGDGDPVISHLPCAQYALVPWMVGCPPPFFTSSPSCRIQRLWFFPLLYLPFFSHCQCAVCVLCFRARAPFSFFLFISLSLRH